MHDLLVLTGETIGRGPVSDPHVDQTVEDRVSLDSKRTEVFNSPNGIPPDGVTEVAL